jgi:small-conductance mechanosensitive channel
MRPSLARLVLSFLIAVTSARALAQSKPAAPPPEKPPATTPGAAQAAAPDQPIPAAEIPDQAEAVAAELRTAEQAAAADETNTRVANTLPGLVRDVDQRIDESRRVIAGAPTLAALRGLETGWEKTRDALASARKEVNGRAAAVDKRAARLAELERRWAATARDGGDETPPDVRARVEDTLGAIRRARARLDREQAEALSLLNRIASEDGRITAMLADIAAARERAVSLLFARQSAPIWSADVIGGTRTAEMFDSGQETYARQFAALVEYVREEAATVALHLAAVAGFAAMLFAIRRRVHAWATRTPALAPGVPVFAAPVAAAVVLATLASRWVYPDGPQLFLALLGAIALVATVVVLRHAADRRLLPLLNVIVVFFVVDQLRAALGTLPLAPRIVFLLEMLAGALFAAGVLRATRRSTATTSSITVPSPPLPPPPVTAPTGTSTGTDAPTLPPPPHAATASGVHDEPDAHPDVHPARHAGIAPGVLPPTRDRFTRWSRIGAQAGLAMFVGAAIASALGFTSLGDFLARAVLGGAYAALILYAVVLILDALVLLALHARPLVLSRMVRLHAGRLHAWAARAFRFAAVVVWVVLLLDRLTLRERAVALGTTILEAGVHAGALHITIGDLIAFGVTVWAAFLVARAATFVLEEDVYPRVTLARGLPYAISATVHYAIVVVGCLLALAALGVDMTKFTILIGALTVGIGFGLQNIINNFVSGLILLFERPVKIGDVIQIGADVGVVQRIGIRASVLRATNGADVILPNGKLISDQLTNWTRSTNVRPIEIPIAVAGTASARDVMKLLEETAAGREGVVAWPKPEALLGRLAADTLGFDLRFWTDQAEDWQRVRSDVALAVSDALAQAGIAIK